MNISYRQKIEEFVSYRYLKPLKQYFIANHHDVTGLEKYKDKKNVFIMQTPTHGNLGDQAIIYAQMEFLIKNLNDYFLIEIPFEDVFKYSKMIKKIVKPNDLIVIHGGGNMGDMYLYEELTRRFIVNSFKHVKIISFPQTISFSPTLFGKIVLMGSKKVYKRNKNFFIVSRESKSYEIMKKEFGEERVILTPDIVLSLNERREANRKGIVTCFRNDEEQVINIVFKEKLLDAIKEKYNYIKVTDTVVKQRVFKEQRKNELQNIWNDFRSAEIVLTDRLHGMIFCAITGTPCIVFKNFNHKIEYSYKDWLCDLDYIKFTDDFNVENILTYIEELRTVNQDAKLRKGINYEKFSSLIDIINK